MFISATRKGNGNIVQPDMGDQLIRHACDHDAVKRNISRFPDDFMFSHL